MSLYNMVNGFNPACVFIMPMLGRRQEEWPRFRDCFVTDEGNIAIYTRVGGGNRNQGYGEEKLYKDPNFIKTYDDSFDSTYATYEFAVPERWKSDFEHILSSEFLQISEDYQKYLRQFFPKLEEEGFFDKIFEAAKKKVEE